MAVGALELDVAQGGETTIQGLSLLLVSKNGIIDQDVVSAVGLGVVGLDGGAGLGSHGVGQALGKDVQRKAGNHNGDAGEQRLPPTAGKHAAAGVSEDVAPCSGGLGDARADEGKGCLEDDGVCDQGNGKDHDGRDAVAQDVLNEDPGSLGTGHDDRANVVLAVFGNDVCTHDTGDLRRVHEADGEDDGWHGVAEDQTKTAARAMPGTDMMMSSRRMMTSDTALRETAATAPTMEPHTRANKVAPKPMTSE